jgi:hypothetical protein
MPKHLLHRLVDVAPHVLRVAERLVAICRLPSQSVREPALHDEFPRDFLGILETQGI